jgi:zinc protease
MHGHVKWALRGFLLFLLSGVSVAKPVEGVSLGPSTDKLGSIDLPSGMRIVIEEDHSKPLVAVVAVINVGSAKDPIGKEGLAHLVEHLTFRAKPDGKVQRVNLLDFAGAASWSASTTHDLTTFMVVGPKESLRNLLVIEGGRLAGPLARLDARAFDVERDIVKNEASRRDEQGNVSAVGAHLYSALYPEGHPYHRPTSGTAASLGALSLSDAQAFVEEHYVPANVTLYVAGDVDMGTIHQVFGATLPERFAVAPKSGPIAPPQRLPAKEPVVPVPPAPSSVETVSAPVDRPMVYLAWSLPYGYGADEALQRLLRSAAEAVPVWTSSTSDIESVRATLEAGPHGTTLLCAVRLKEGRIPAKSLDRLFDQVHYISQPAPPPSAPQAGQLEASSWNQSQDGSFGRNLPNGYTNQEAAGTSPVTDNSNGMYSVLGGAAAAFAPRSVSLQLGRLQMTAVVGDALETESLLARAVDRATLVHWTGSTSAWGKDMNAMTAVGNSTWEAYAFKWLARDRAAIVFVQPSGVSVSSFSAVGTPSVFASDEVRVKIAAGALRTYAHGPVGDIRALTLKNGLQVLLVQRLGSPTVAATLGANGGGSTGDPLGAAPLALDLLTPAHSPTGPPSEFGARVSYRMSAGSAYVEGRAASGNLEDLLAVISDAVESPQVSIPFGTWHIFLDDKRRDEALVNVAANRSFRTETYPGSAYGRTALTTNIEKLGTGDGQRWMDRSFRPGNAVLAVVGDIDVAEAQKQVRQAFDGWRGDVDRRAQAPLGRLSERSGAVRLLVVDRTGAQDTEIRVGCSVPTETDAELIALRLLGTRLRTKLSTLARSTLGGSNGFTGGASFEREVSHLDVAGEVDARSLIPVLAFIRKEMASLDELKTTEEEVALLRWRQGTAWNGDETNSEVADVLVRTRLANLSLDLVQKYPDLLAGVTPEDVTRVAATCRKTAVLLVSGDPTLVDKALLATENSAMLLHQGN